MTVFTTPRPLGHSFGVSLWLLCLLLSPGLHAQTSDFPVCVAEKSQSAPGAVPDGSGGMYVAWFDARRDTVTDLYIQHVSSSGSPLWQTDGILIAKRMTTQVPFQMISDGTQGAIIVWKDYRANPQALYAQRITSDGTFQWGEGGIPFAGSSGFQTSVVMTSDGAGGAIVAWRDSRSELNDIYAQRITSAGESLWEAGGFSVSLSGAREQSPAITADGANGALVFWLELGEGGEGAQELYAQRVSAAGEAMWASRGMRLSFSGCESYASPLPDGGGGALLALQVPASGGSQLIVQRVNGDGSIAWNRPPNVSSLSTFRSLPSLLRGSSDDFFTVWQDTRAASGSDVFLQRHDLATGRGQWVSGGVPLCTLAANQSSPSIVEDGEGGVFAVWHDYRHGVQSSLYGQRINVSGDHAFDAGGARLFPASTNQSGFVPMGVNSAAAVLVWIDQRNGSEGDIYGGKVIYEDFKGNAPLDVVAATGWNMLSLPVTVSDARRVSIFPSAISQSFVFGDGYEARDTIPYGAGFWLKFAAEETLTFDGLHRTFESIALREGWNMVGTISTPVSLADVVTEPADLLLGKFFQYNGGYESTELLTPGRGFWVKAKSDGSLILNAGGKSRSGTTRRSSGAADDFLASCDVLTITDSEGHRATLYLAPAGSSFSAAARAAFELPPVPPHGVFDARFASHTLVEELAGDPENVRGLPIELSGAAFPISVSFTGAASNASAFITAGADQPAREVKDGMRVTFEAFSGSRLSVLPAAGGALPARFHLAQNYPNPFNPSSTIVFDLAGPALVDLGVFTLLGEEVLHVVREQLYTAGTHRATVTVEGLPSGIYYYRLTARATDRAEILFQSAKKMVYLR